MNKFLIALLFLPSISNADGFVDKIVDKLASMNKPKAENVIVLKESNLLSLRVPVTRSSIAPIQKKAVNMSRELDEDEQVYFWLDTPGGEIYSGNELINTLRSIQRPVHTITNFAASMGYVFVQSLDKRYVVEEGVLMMHRPYVQFEGEFPEQFTSRINDFSNSIAALDGRIAARIGVPTMEYLNMTEHEYWVSGKRTVDVKMADKVVVVKCDKSLRGTTTEYFDTFFGKLSIKWNKCPLISAPESISLADDGVITTEKQDFLEFVKQSLSDRRKFASSVENKQRWQKAMKMNWDVWW